MAVVCSVRWAASLVAPAAGLRAAGWVLSSLLPELVNKLTPDGQAPQGDLDIGSLLARFS